MSSFPPNVLQHLQYDCVSHSNNSKLQFINRGYRGFVNNVGNIPTGRNQVSYYQVSVEATELVHCTQQGTQENTCQKILGQYEPLWVVHHLADDLPTEVIASPLNIYLKLIYQL
jgi:hypothetical protein